MDFPKYDGNIHPNEWINDIKRYFKLKNTKISDRLSIAISLVEPIISLPSEIGSLDKLCNVLKEDISFTVFKNTNERMLQSLKYVPENKGEFEDFAIYLSNLIVNESIVALKHVATGKYLSSENFYYKTGSKSQLVFVGSTEPVSNSLWRIKSNKELNELISYTDTFITLQHDKSKKFLGINYGKSYYNHNDRSFYYKSFYHTSPSNNHSEVSCINTSNHGYCVKDWEFNHAKVGNHQEFIKSNDIINLSIKKVHDNNGNTTTNGQVEFLRSIHDVRFTIENDAFQEVHCHNEKLGGNDEWCIELIKQYNWI
ncbi:hypothetical protein GLOIN_2v1767426 [Rhizophagus irregularis DAOM 181602=DAOM 197198]|nr:hypothetical protein GLOIN_2v1767426 [Rhizophagus irregularis DAOM 181602=DAOM 197198]